MKFQRKFREIKFLDFKTELKNLYTVYHNRTKEFIYINWPEEYAKYPVFSTFEADFCTKTENSPPNVIGDEN